MSVNTKQLRKIYSPMRNGLMASTIVVLCNELDEALARIAELEAENAAMKEAYREEVRQFNAGHDAFFSGEPSDAAPSFEADYDVWTCGWAWAKFVKDEAHNRQDEE